MPEGEGAATTSLTMALQHFYRTSMLACPYLTDRAERKVVTELAGRDARALYNDLSRAGFRRSHHLAYRPACPACNACVPVRVDVAGFEPSRTMRRIAQRNLDLSAIELPAAASPEHFRLFSRYQQSRHADSDMADMTIGDFRAMVEDSPIDTRIIEFRDQTGRLIAACLVDRLDDGYSAVYSYFDPTDPTRSFGTLMILRLIEAAHAANLPFVYLGYWIADSAKMDYKRRFRPMQGLEKGEWREVPSG